MKTDEKAQTVGGYLFYTEADAKLARAEGHKIKYLEEHMDYSSPESIKYIYEKAIQDRIFRTPVGLQYLKHLQDFLLERQVIRSENITAIPLDISFSGQGKECVYCFRDFQRASCACYLCHVRHILKKRSAQYFQL